MQRTTNNAPNSSDSLMACLLIQFYRCTRAEYFPILFVIMPLRRDRYESTHFGPKHSSHTCRNPYATCLTCQTIRELQKIQINKNSHQFHVLNILFHCKYSFIWSFRREINKSEMKIEDWLSKSWYCYIWMNLEQIVRAIWRMCVQRKEKPNFLDGKKCLSIQNSEMEKNVWTFDFASQRWNKGMVYL